MLACGGAGVVKRAGLKILWVSPCEGPNPSSRIFIFSHNYSFIKYIKRKKIKYINIKKIKYINRKERRWKAIPFGHFLLLP